MATQEIEKLIVSLEASTKKYEQALAKAQGTTVSRLRKMEKEAESFATRFDRKLAGIGSSLKGIGAGFVAGLGVEVLARAAASAIKSIADIGDAATKLGLSNAEFQTLKLGAQLAGVEVEALASGMKKLGVNSSEAERGQGKFGEILKANNISLTDANGQMRSQVEVLGIVANLVANAANEQDGLAIAQAALGKSGTELMGLLEQGASGVQEAMRKAKEAGVQFTDEQIAKAQEFDDKIDVLIEKVSVGLKGAFINAAPDIEASIRNTVREVNTLISAVERASQVLNNLVSPALKQGIDQTSIPRLDLGGGASVPNPYYKRPVVTGPTNGFLPPYIPERPAAYKPGTVGPFKPKTKMPDDPSIARDREASEKAAANAAKRRREQIADAISDLKFEGQQLKANALQQAINTELRKADVSATSAQGQQIIALVTANHALETSKANQKKLDEERTKFQKKWADTEFSIIEQTNERYRARQQEMHDAMTSLAEIGYSAFESVVIGGTKAKDAVKGLVKELAAAVLKSALLGQGPLGAAGGGGGGFFGKLLGSVAGAFGGGAPVSLYHKGGTIGKPSGMSANVSPAIFRNAPSYHSGGMIGGRKLKSGERPIIGEDGEIVLKKGTQIDGGEAQTVNVMIHTSPELWAEVDRRNNQTAGNAVRVSVAQSGMQAKKNFGAMATENNMRTG